MTESDDRRWTLIHKNLKEDIQILEQCKDAIQTRIIRHVTTCQEIQDELLPPEEDPQVLAVSFFPMKPTAC